MKYAIYRCLFGEDFIEQSVMSIEPHVDKIFIFMDSIPWGDITECQYFGKIIKFPDKFDNVFERVKNIPSKKIEIIFDHVYSPYNQFTHLVNDIIFPNYSQPQTIVFIEPDHVFHENHAAMAFLEFEQSGAINASTRQIEHWRHPEYYVPERLGRLSVVFWNTKELNKIPVTGTHADTPDTSLLNSYVHNFGFCISEQTMLWKHLLAIGASSKTGDSQPNENWYRDKWLTWDYEKNNTNLEISLGCEHNIQAAYKYPTNELPASIKLKYQIV